MTLSKRERVPKEWLPSSFDKLELDTRKLGNKRTSNPSKARQPEKSGDHGNFRYLKGFPRAFRINTRKLKCSNIKQHPLWGRPIRWGVNVNRIVYETSVTSHARQVGTTSPHGGISLLLSPSTILVCAVIFRSCAPRPLLLVCRASTSPSAGELGWDFKPAD